MKYSDLDVVVRGFPVRGTYAGGFEEVAEAFARNFENGLEIGAAAAAYRGDEVLFDLWGGFKDRKRTDPWESDTMACVHSSTKAISALAVRIGEISGLLGLGWGSDHDPSVKWKLSSSL